MPVHRLAAGPLLLLALAVPPAGAQEARIGRDGYRQDVPAVIVPPRPRAPVETPFEAAYRRAGHPRLILFFNRDIADTASAGMVLHRRDEQVTHGDMRQPPGDGGRGLAGGSPDSRSSDGVFQGRLHTDRRQEVRVERQATGQRGATLDEASQWLFESAFTNRLAADRIRLVDRSLAIRLASATRIDDPQQLELAAIRTHADLALVVRGARTALSDGGDGLLFRVTVINTRTGQLVTDIVTAPAAVDAARSAATGEALAVQLVQRLLAEWQAGR